MECKEENTNAELNLASSTRRELLKKALSLSATMAVANTGVYMIGAAFKELDGSLVAGAKTCNCVTTAAAPDITCQSNINPGPPDPSPFGSTWDGCSFDIYESRSCL